MPIGARIATGAAGAAKGAEEAASEGMGGALGRFAHNNLLKGASASATTQMVGGAGAGAALGAVGSVTGMGPTGGDGVLGGAMHGAILGAGFGAATKMASAKYGAGAMSAGGKSFKTSHFTNDAAKEAKFGDVIGKDKLASHMDVPTPGPSTGVAPSANKASPPVDKATALQNKGKRDTQVAAAKAKMNNYNNGTSATPRQSVRDRVDAAAASKADLNSKVSAGYGTAAAEGHFDYADSGNSLNAVQAAIGFGRGMPSAQQTTDAWMKQVGPIRPPKKGKK